MIAVCLSRAKGRLAEFKKTYFASRNLQIFPTN